VTGKAVLEGKETKIAGLQPMWRGVPHLCGLPRRVRQGRLLLMLKLRGFFDESDTHEPADKQVFTLGGWVTTVETWDRFSDDWDKVLRQSPAISYFKHHEAKGPNGEFEGWTAKDADAKIMALAEVIDKHLDPDKRDYGFITGMKPEMLRFLYRNSPATPKQRRSVLKFTTPYHLCFFNVISCVRQIELGIDRASPVDFVFDAGSDVLPECALALREMKKSAPSLFSLIGTVTEGDDKELAPLQAADLLVGQASSNLKNGKPDAPFRLLFQRRRILFSPLTTGGTHDKFLQGFASILERFNVTWSSLMLERAAKKTDSE
jgi:hypothetical protein